MRKKRADYLKIPANRVICAVFVARDRELDHGIVLRHRRRQEDLEGLFTLLGDAELRVFTDACQRHDIAAPQRGPSDFNSCKTCANPEHANLGDLKRCEFATLGLSLRQDLFSRLAQRQKGREKPAPQVLLSTSRSQNLRLTLVMDFSAVRPARAVLLFART